MKFSTHISEFEPPIPNPQPFVDKAFALYQTITETGRGKVVFVVGELGRGKTEIMRSIAEAFKQTKSACNVIDGCFIDGKYQPFIHKVKADYSQTSDTIGNIASSLAKIVSPRFDAFLDFGGQLLQTIAASAEFVNAHTANLPDKPEVPYWLLKIIREAAKEKPLVCVIDDFDKSDETFDWNFFLLSLAEEIAVDLPILFIVSIKSKASVGEHQIGENNLEYVTRELVGRGLADWQYINPMSREDIADWISLDTSLGIVSQLHNVTGGNSRWVQNLWRDWRINGNVILNEHKRIWEFSPDKKPALNQLKGSFEDLLKTLLNTDDLSQIGEAKKMLGLAALEGERFTAEVSALALGIDTDELIDYLDDNLLVDESRPNGILLENGSIEIETAPNVKKVLWRYKFVSDWHWQILNRYAFPTVEEKFKYAGEMIQALKIVFETNERFAAKSLAKLYKTVKDDESARNYQQIADYAMSFEKTRELALALLQVDTTDWDQFRCQQLGVFLLKAGEKIKGANPYDDLAIFEKAEELASTAFDTVTQADSLAWVASIHADFGEFKIAEKKAAICINLYNKLNKKTNEASAYNILGYIYYAGGKYDKAETLFKKAIVISEKILGENHFTTTVCYANLAGIYDELGRFDEAERLFKKVILIREKVLGENHPSNSTTYNNLAGLYQSQGRYAEAEPLYKKALAICESVLGEHHPSTAATYNNLAGLYQSQGRYAEAEPLYKKALAICESVLGEHHPNTITAKQNLEILKQKLAHSK
jgi:tetratricopeptide (TPR) repeat protein